jgi:hypothetical protein
MLMNRWLSGLWGNIDMVLIQILACCRLLSNMQMLLHFHYSSIGRGVIFCIISN